MVAVAEVVLFEYLSGGGEGSAGLVPEGLCLLRALAEGFAELPGFTPSVVLGGDCGKAVSFPSGVDLHAAPMGEGGSVFLDVCRSADYAVMVAPETGGIAAFLARQVETTGAGLLGPSSEAVAQASHKARLMEALTAQGVPVPSWEVVRDPAEVRTAADRLGYPLVCKPLQDTGCGGSLVLPSQQTAMEALDGVSFPLFAQPLEAGSPASLSLAVATGGQTSLLMVNRQTVVLQDDRRGIGRFAYRGGVAALPREEYRTGGGPTREELQCLSQSVAAALPGLRGLIGVDLLFGPRGPVVLEVNPRPTTPLAVAALRNPPLNLARILVDACCRNRLPGNPLELPRIAFTKEELS